MNVCNFIPYENKIIYKMENDNPQKGIDTHSDNNISLKDGKSTENFQKFIYEVFEKNGVLNDLRAYLRGHIINILKSIHSGDTLMSEKHFTQRLELKFQALNMLIAEYLLRLDFTYTLSVFISEIPLANMVFDLAKSLLDCNTDNAFHKLTFKDSDVWHVLNCIGVKCDSESASTIVDMYRKDPQCPLLLCILKSIPLYLKQPECFEEVNNSEGNSSSSRISDNSYPVCNDRKSEPVTTCKHYAFCKSCQRRIKRIRRKYKRKKVQIYESAKRSSVNLVNVESFLRNIDVMERSIIDEMFEQLKTVYETEVEMVKEGEERKIKRSLANHALLLQKRYDEMEESFKSREMELENNLQEKKKFLWGLARSLREQHCNMSNAMKAVQHETERLTAKEESLKNQISEAEQILKKRGDEMRSQISNELIVLEGHLDSMKRDRDVIDKERTELEKLKELCNSNTKITTDTVKEREELHSHYNSLRDELTMLKKFIASTKVEPKCVMERGVMTDNIRFMATMNNGQDLEKNVKNDGGVRTPNQVINDLKKQKNVNSSQPNLEDIVSDHNRDRSRSRLSVSSEAAEDQDLILLLREENERLKTFAEQQRGHIDELSREHVRLRSELAASRLAAPRPRTAPAVMPTNDYIAARGYLINQWRSPRRRFSPLRGVNQIKPTPICPRAATSGQDTTGQCSSIPQSMPPQQLPANEKLGNSHDDHDDRMRQRPEATLEVNKAREKSPKSVLREAKQKLRNKDSIKHEVSMTSREKSPNSMLREAKLRLRKLEIEAEAVEKSYLDFRRRRSELKNEEFSLDKESVPSVEAIDQVLNVQHKSSSQKHKQSVDVELKANEIKSDFKVTKEFLKQDFDTYLTDYQIKHDIVEPRFANKTTTAVKIKPIPDFYLKLAQEFQVANTRQSVNYLETPLTEFRKLYHNTKSTRQTRIKNYKSKSSAINHCKTKCDKEDVQVIPPLERHIETIVKHRDVTETERLEQSKESTENNKLKTLELKSVILEPLNNPISFNKQINDTPEIDRVSNNATQYNENILEVEVETVTECKKFKITDSQDDLMIIVQSSINTKELTISQDDIEKHVPVTTASPGFGSPASAYDSKLDRSQHIDELKVGLVLDSPLLNQSVRSSGNTNFEKSRSPDESSTSPPFKQSVSSPNKKVSNGSKYFDKLKSSPSPEQADHITRNDVLDAIFHTEPAEDASSVDIGLVDSKDGLDSFNRSEGDAKDYPDDFSADVDNYYSRSELENSPISLPKTSEDDNFWD